MANQQFIFKSDELARYRIFCAQNGKVVDCQYSNESSGANVCLYDYNNTPKQHWYLRAQGDGKFSLTAELILKETKDALI